MPSAKRDTSGGFTPSVQLTADVVVPSNECLRLDGQLEKRLLSPAIHQVMLGMARLRNAISSFRLEGEAVDLDRARRVLDGSAPANPSELGVLRLAKEYERLGREEPSLPTVRELLALHTRLFTDVLEPEIVGRLKDRPNFIVEEGTNRLRFTPTPPERTEAELQALSEWYSRSRWTYPPAIVASVYFAEFQAIHPFGNGNGRMGRLLNVLILKDLGMRMSPLVPFDTRLFRTSESYYEKLGTTNSGEMYGVWNRYFVHELREAYRLASSRADLGKLVSRFSRPSTRAVLRWVLHGSSAWFAYRDYPNKSHYSHPAIWSAFSELVRAGVLEARGERKGRRYRLSTSFIRGVYGRVL